MHKVGRALHRRVMEGKAVATRPGVPDIFTFTPIGRVYLTFCSFDVGDDFWRVQSTV